MKEDTQGIYEGIGTLPHGFPPRKSLHRDDPKLSESKETFEKNRDIGPLESDSEIRTPGHELQWRMVDALELVYKLESYGVTGVVAECEARRKLVEKP